MLFSLEVNMAQANLSINASLNIQQILNSIKQIRNGLNTLSLPKGLDKQFDSTATKLEKSLNELSTFSGKELKIDEAKQALKIIQDIQKAGVSFQGVLNNIGGLDLKSLKLEEFVQNYDNITNAIKRYEQAIENVQKNSSSAYSKAVKEQKDQQNKINEVQRKINSQETVKDTLVLKLRDEKQALEEAKKAAEDYKKTVSAEEYEKSDQRKRVTDAENNVNKTAAKIKEVEDNIKRAKELIVDYEKEISKLESKKKKSISASPAVQNSWNEIIQLLKSSGAEGVENIAKYDIEAVQSALNKLETTQGDKVRKLLEDIQKNANGAAKGVKNLGNSSNNLKGAVANTEQFNRELDMMQNRIQYFFGLNNSIQLLKRGL